MSKQIAGRNGGTLSIPEKGDPSRNPHGRPRKMFSQFVKELKEAGYERVTRASYMEALEVLLDVDVAKAKEIADDETASIAMRTVAKMLLNPKTAMKMTRELWDRAHGRVLQPGEPGSLPQGQNINILALFQNTKDLKPITTEADLEGFTDAEVVKDSEKDEAGK